MYKLSHGKFELSFFDFSFYATVVFVLLSNFLDFFSFYLSYMQCLRMFLLQLLVWKQDRFTGCV